MAEVKLFGYCNNISVRPGDEQTFHVTADGTDTAEAQNIQRERLTLALRRFGETDPRVIPFHNPVSYTHLTLPTKRIV